MITLIQAPAERDGLILSLPQPLLSFSTITVCASLHWAKSLEHRLSWGSARDEEKLENNVFLYKDWEHCAGNTKLWYFIGIYFIIVYAKS